MTHRILVVDDAWDMRECLATLLVAHGYEVSTAANASDALLQLAESPPSVILSDLQMPNVPGWELISVVRRQFPQVRIIAMSGGFGRGTVPSGVRADAFYAKGSQDPRTLLKTIADLIRTSPSRGNAQERKGAPIWIRHIGTETAAHPPDASELIAAAEGATGSGQERHQEVEAHAPDFH
jgi:CheY-like chemotaxis protein